ncbi:MAG: hypothetical protein BWX64_02040 [Acidobacteria bacterium ADurb.Bin051]|nr:MAG: hypothetical protein BWX64_02040 [Acidobacteria bacterium ADurb.Bin051]
MEDLHHELLARGVDLGDVVEVEVTVAEGEVVEIRNAAFLVGERLHRDPAGRGARQDDRSRLHPRGIGLLSDERRVRGDAERKQLRHETADVGEGHRGAERVGGQGDRHALLDVLVQGAVGSEADVAFRLDLGLLAALGKQGIGKDDPGVGLEVLDVEGDVLRRPVVVTVLVRDPNLVAGLPEELVSGVEILLGAVLDREGVLLLLGDGEAVLRCGHLHPLPDLLEAVVGLALDLRGVDQEFVLPPTHVEEHRRPVLLDGLDVERLGLVGGGGDAEAAEDEGQNHQARDHSLVHSKPSSRLAPGFPGGRVHPGSGYPGRFR